MSLADEENVQPLLSEQDVETGEPILPAAEPQVTPEEAAEEYAKPEPLPEPTPDDEEEGA